MGAGIAGTVAGPILGNLALMVGLLPAFACVAIVCGLIAIALPRENIEASPEPPRTHVAKAAGNLILIGGVLTYAVVAICYGALFLLLPLRMSGEGLSDMWIGWVFTVAAVGSACVSMIAGRAVDRIGTTVLIVISLAATSVIMAFFVPQLDLVLTVLLVLLAAGFALPLAITPVATAIALDAEAFGAARATGPLLMIVFALGEVLGSISGGAIAKQFTDSVVVGALSLLAAASIVLVLTTNRIRSRAMSR
jgi:predicted MFS family arabinose efflux permease